ncbi:hypothetical protein DM02DRAFT_704981 [Periconia macrospinosa]|uniref:F-box domain-containing protein n=1 Tax=Periconia macrospinosa TaxID=97972 RepID=A0A2V1DTC4_9PLEO|nr:hypothetical protein DM02DRAFT_704981 [Periconia macrospinosa]
MASCVAATVAVCGLVPHRPPPSPPVNFLLSQMYTKMGYHLLSFPNETLLNIFAHLVNHHEPAAYSFRTQGSRQIVERDTKYYRDLCSVSLTCKRLSILARELLLKEIVVPYVKLDRLLECFIQYPQLTRLPQSLDVVQGYFNPPGSRKSSKTDEEFREGCWELIANLNISDNHKTDWMNSVDIFIHDRTTSETDLLPSRFVTQDAVFCLLLAALPNLKRLQAGTLRTPDVPVLQDMLWDYHAYTPSPAHLGYLREAMLLVAPKLTHLEVPLNWSAVRHAYNSHYGPSSLKILREFTNLHTLTIPPFSFPPMLLNPDMFPSYKLPPTLRHINVVGDRHLQLLEGTGLLCLMLEEREVNLRGISIHQLISDSRNGWDYVDFNGQDPAAEGARRLAERATELGIILKVHFTREKSTGEKTTIADYVHNRDSGLEPVPKPQSVPVTEPEEG